MSNSAVPRPMRRSKREVRDAEDIHGIIERCQTLRLGLHDEQGVFIVPVSFGYDWECEEGGTPQLTFWFHSAKEGRKVDALAADPVVAIELDVGLDVIGGDFACTYSLSFESIMGVGVVRRAETPEKVRYGLSRLMEHMAPGAPVEFSDSAVAATDVYAVEVRELSAKRRDAE